MSTSDASITDKPLHGDWGIVGHAAAVEQLAASIRAGRVSHAYLITGPAEVGRTALALALARALNCEAPLGERPCNVCDSCGRIKRRTHPDVTLVDFEWQDAMIARTRGDQMRQRMSINAVKWLCSDVAIRPFYDRWKIHILDEADRFSTEAPDAYLKTLEEPPSYAVMVLIAQHEDDVSETVRSRCRHISLANVPTNTIRDALIARGTPAALADTIARAARGRAAWAIRMADDPKLLLKRTEQVNDAFEKISSPLGRVEIAGIIARDYTKKRETTLRMLDDWLGLWRDALLHRTGLGDSVAYPEIAEQVGNLAFHYEIDDLYRAIWSTQRCMSDLHANVQARIAMHAMVMQWPAARTGQ